VTTAVIEHVEPHALALENAANEMEAAGIGLHPEEGHVHHLRKMAGHMRAEAALGQIASKYPLDGQVHAASAAPASAPTVYTVPGAIMRVLRAAGVQAPPAGQRISAAALDERFAAASIGTRDRLMAKEQLLRLGLLA